MSQSGITVYNANNNLVLDNTYKNFYLTSVGRKDPDYVKKMTELTQLNMKDI